MNYKIFLYCTSSVLYRAASGDYFQRFICRTWFINHLVIRMSENVWSTVKKNKDISFTIIELLLFDIWFHLWFIFWICLPYDESALVCLSLPSWKPNFPCRVRGTELNWLRTSKYSHLKLQPVFVHFFTKKTNKTKTNRTFKGLARRHEAARVQIATSPTALVLYLYHVTLLLLPPKSVYHKRQTHFFKKKKKK